MNPTLKLLSILGGQLNPSRLFRSGDLGAVYDPSDLSLMYQEAAGTTAAAVSSPIGLLLDNRWGLSWTGVLAPVDQFTFAAAGTTAPTTNAANTYLTQPCVSATFPILGSGGFSVSRAEGGGASVWNITGGNKYRAYYTFALSRPLTGAEKITLFSTGATGDWGYDVTSATGSTSWNTVVASGAPAVASGTNSVFAYANSALGSPVTIYLRQYAVENLPGNHSRQATAGSRPTLNAGGKVNYSSGTKSLVTTWASSLGSSCTVAHAIPGGTASILTGQTITTTYTDTTDHCGLVIINRSLTATETNQLTRWLVRKGAAA